MFEFSEKKLYKPFSNNLEKPQIVYFLKIILAVDTPFFWMSAIYSIIISLLSLVVPISVQSLINSIIYTALLQPVIVIGLIITILLSFYGLINIMQIYVTEIFQRRFFARMSCESSMSLLNADYKKLEESNQYEMVNRFFETVTIQKQIPKFLTKTFTVILQSFFGLILISFYHPVFLVFSLILLATIAMIWRFFYKNAILTAFYESRRKYDLVGWLEDIATNQQIFKSTQGRIYAQQKVDFLTGQYIKERKSHFAGLFLQNILLFTLYTIATTSLLVIGGYLVLNNQLTIGQLVAAELVVAAILYNTSQLGRDFENFYDLIASCEKLSQFQNIPSEVSGKNKIDKEIESFEFDKFCCSYLEHKYQFNLKFEKGKNYLIATKGFSTRKLLIEAINGFQVPETGHLVFNNHDIDSLDKTMLRSRIAVIDNTPLIEGTALEYLSFNDKNISAKEVESAIRTVGLEKAFERFPDGLKTRIIPSGWPFSESEKILIKLARALIHKPQIIIITEVLDMLILQARHNILEYLTKNRDITVLYFSHRNDNTSDFDEYLFVDKTKSYKFNSMKDLDQFEIKYQNHEQ